MKKDFGLPQWKIYELLPEDYKREYKVGADGNLVGTSKDDESEFAKSANLSQVVVDQIFKGKGFTELDAERMLVAELKKLNIEPELKVRIDRPYKYPQPYFMDVKVGNVTMDIVGKSTLEEVELRDKFFREKGLYPVHFPMPMVKKYAPLIASLVKTFMSFVSKYKVKS